MKVLIIDDSPDAVAIATARLRQDGLQVVSAADGRAGLDLAAAQRPDLILLDVAMPDMSGFDVCRQLKSDLNLSTIPIIFLTAMDDTLQKVRGLELGAVDYVTKPFDAFELRARVQAALRTKRFADMLTEFANIDPLTELPNRRAFINQLNKEWARKERHGDPFALIMADIDYFKRVNDTYGHSVGDRMLKAVSKALADQCRELDLAARYGGEEFAIIAPNQSAEAAGNLAERCRQGVEHIRLHVTGSDISVTISFGVADSQGLHSIAEVIELADRCLYQAKLAGRNTVFRHSERVHS
ncbi:hypothetical protein LCGC14_0312410 [marine sediment metagenome]|uniref:Uncharacterized protein n=1 Tax=marine sediment metagenome TaxID=412755 RepID=A0A0F9TS09_9ZZZZ|nr:diguanylate cyclase [Phycisphaerae bacterium]HDZ44815.1 diguanylate cyclase [Phycisphaerae bacterium]